MENKITFGSLFAGIGGFDLGFERAGMVCKWQVEIDDYCNKVLAKHWPDVRRYRDVRECGKHNLETVDVICGGFPCQPHSVAGKRRGKDDDRDLWPEYRRIVAELRPAWVVGENVPGIRTTILDEVLSDLEGLDYTTTTFNLPACGFDAPHRRERIFVVAHTKYNGRDGRQRTNEHQRQHDPMERSKQLVGDGFDRDVADANSRRQQERHPKERSLSVLNTSGNVTDANVKRLAQRESQRSNACQKQQATIRADWWSVEPDVGGTLDGFSTWLDGVDLTNSHVLYLAHANAKKERPNKILSTLRSLIEAPQYGRYASISQAEVLFTYLCKLQESQFDQAWIQLAGKKASEELLRSVRSDNEPSCPPYRPGYNEQYTGEYPDSLQELSRLLALNAEAARMDYRRSDAYIGGWEDGIARITTRVPNRLDRLRALGNAVVPQVAEFIARGIVEAHGI